MPVIENHLPLKRITNPEYQHYYGYYLNKQYNHENRLLLGHRCDIIGRWQKPEDVAELGVINLENGSEWIPLAKSHAWNWQMGSMLQWLPDRNNGIIYNDRKDGQLVSIIRDIDGSHERVLAQPISTIHPNGKWALTLNLARKWVLWPETGYCGVVDPWSAEKAPDGDGLINLNLQTGKSEVIISFRAMLDFDPEIPQNAPAYSFSHPLYNESGTRFAFWFFSQYGPAQDYNRHIRTYTANDDGTDIRFFAAPNSHTCWLGDDKLLIYVYTVVAGRQKIHHRLFDETTGASEPFGENLLTFDSHSTFSPDKKWLMMDRHDYVNHMQHLCLYHLETKTLCYLAHLNSRDELLPGLRCHLHQRWNNSGTEISIDSTHEGSRHIYTMDLSEILLKANGED